MHFRNGKGKGNNEILKSDTHTWETNFVSPIFPSAYEMQLVMFLCSYIYRCTTPFYTSIIEVSTVDRVDLQNVLNII